MPGFHKFNKELTTPCLNPLLTWFKFVVGATGAVGVISQLKANLVESITRNSAGVYTVQLTRPFPESLVNARVDAHRLLPTDVAVKGDYRVGSYSKTLGTFIIHFSNTTGVAIATDPIVGGEVHVNVTFAGRKGTSD